MSYDQDAADLLRENEGLRARVAELEAANLALREAGYRLAHFVEMQGHDCGCLTAWQAALTAPEVGS